MYFTIDLSSIAFTRKISVFDQNLKIMSYLKARVSLRA
ncbi:hypothetical protein SAMN05216269_11527 [Flavobacterium xinjiangense]|uniref:Uncharacterized protein n=1 Tax=Flavobacterium xinjiangense TaxID=178356 RepID=A0A1M7PAF2_9FLAO|nr:hypothetical protein SAMN05216269_11527 [Flavobacterium xinjiangense]